MSESEYEHVTVERVGDVGRIVMDRPERNNAMNRPMAREMRDATVELVVDDGVRCIVLTGTEGVFNTGADLTTLEASPGDAAQLRQVAGRLHGAVSQLARAPKPVVAGVNGVAAGGGMGPALCADLVLMAESARFEFAYPRIGLSGDGGSTYYLPRLVGLRTAQEIALRDDPIPAAEAVELGLATEVVPDDEFEEHLAEEAATLAGGPTLAYAATKGLLRQSFDRSLDEQLAAEAETIAGLTSTADYARGIEAFLGTEDDQAAFEGQ